MSALQNSVVFLKCVGCQSPVDKKAMLAFQSSILIFHCLNISYHVGSAKLVSFLSVLSSLDFAALDFGSAAEIFIISSETAFQTGALRQFQKISDSATEFFIIRSKTAF